MGKNMITVDGRILDTDNRFHDYCKRNKIADPFEERQKRFSARCHNEIRNGHKVIIVETDEDESWYSDWAKRRDEFLRLSHTFRLWDFHFWMAWEQFEWYLKYYKDYTDVSIYMPCDCADRQCSMTCAYFGAECLRANTELKKPEILEETDNGD